MCGRALAPLKVGSVLASRYEILGVLGRGGMGTVYKALDRILEEVVAVKVLRADTAMEPELARRFRSEIKLARKVRHPNVCAIHEYGEEGSLRYIAMEYVQGTDLREEMRVRGALPVADAFDTSLQIAEGLDAAHRVGVVHRDLKTPNIMRGEDGVVRLMDFGIAKRLGPGDSSFATAVGIVMGTPEYMSPEQARGDKVDFRSDIYSLGVLVFELFTGHVPFHGHSPVATIMKQIHEPPPLEGPDVAGIPPAMMPVLRKALAKDPLDRYQTARDFIEALRRAHDESQASSRPEKTEPGEVTEDMPRPTFSGFVPPPPSTMPSPEPTRLPITTPAPAAAALAKTVQKVSVPTARVEVTAAFETPEDGKRRRGIVVPVVAGLLVLLGIVFLLTRRDEPPALESTEARAVPKASQPVESTMAAERLVEPTPQPRVEAPRATPPPREATAPPPPKTLAVHPSPTASAPPAIVVPTSPSTTIATPQAPAGSDGILQVGVRPWAEVAVDGRKVGVTPLNKVVLTPGPHTVILSHPSFEPLARTVTVHSGETSRLIVDLMSEGVRKR